MGFTRLGWRHIKIYNGVIINNALCNIFSYFEVVVK